MTPTAGLEDLYVHGSTTLPAALQLRVVYHLFFSDRGSADYGQEFDAALGRRFGDHVHVLAKIAIFFDGNRDFALADRQKYWLQMEIKF